MTPSALGPCRIAASRHGCAFVRIRMRYLNSKSCANISARSFSETTKTSILGKYSNKRHISDHARHKPLASIVSRLDEYELAPPPPDIVKVKKGQRIVSIGDIHGDIRALTNFLLVAGLLDPASTRDEPVWSGGDTICVQIGDVLDRGDYELECHRMLASLSRQAAQEGGALVLLYGNHEALNAAGVFDYATERGNLKYEEEIGTRINAEMKSNMWRVQFAGLEPARWASLEPGGLLAEPLLSKLKVAVIVGRTVFVHAGLTTDHIKEYGSIQAMNKAAQDWILGHHCKNDNLGLASSTEEIIDAAEKRALAASRIMPSCLGGGNFGDESPVWMRAYSAPSDVAPDNSEGVQKLLDDTLAELNNDVQRMVMGHTPQQQINVALMGKAWRIDIGASQGISSGEPEALEIIHGGDNEDDEISILTREGRVSVSEREARDYSSNRLLGSFFGMK